MIHDKLSFLHEQLLAKFRPCGSLVGPVTAAIVVPMQSILVISRECRLVREFGRLFDSFAGEMDEDFRFTPTNPLDPLRCDEHSLSRPPVPRIDDEIANRPGLVINDEILNVANSAILGFNAISSHVGSAAQMRIPASLGYGSFLPLFAVARNIGIGTPHVRTTPI